MVQAERHGVDFDSFFACKDGATPASLLRANVYHSVAAPLKGGEWRPASLAMLTASLAADPEAGEAVTQAEPSSTSSSRSWWGRRAANPPRGERKGHARRSVAVKPKPNRVVSSDL